MPQANQPRVGILMGSDTDWPVMSEAAATLKNFGVAFEARVLSAHRSPAQTADYARAAAERGLRVLIIAAGGAAHLGGVVAAETSLPVIGVPMPTTSLAGLDSLLSIVQMPSGVPVACTSIGKPGAVNAAVLAVQILATSDGELAEKLAAYKRQLAEGVAEKNARLQQQLKP